MSEMFVGVQDPPPADILGMADWSRGVITSIMLLSTGRVVLPMWTLGVEVERCLWERPPPVGG